MRIRQLDILRAIAVLLVIGRHWKPAPDDCTPVIALLVNAWERCGWIGVDLFFVLSGFLISGLLFREHIKRQSIDLKRFLVRRAFKIYPAFYLMLGTIVVFGAAFGAAHPIGPVLSEALFIQNYSYRIFPHTWSLAVEEHFYIALPLLMLLLAGSRASPAGDPFRRLVGIFAIVGPGLLLARLVTAWSQPFSVSGSYFPTHLRIDSLLFGVVLSYWHHYHGERTAEVVKRWKPLLVPLGLVLVAPSVILPTTHPFMYTAGFTCLYLGFGAILMSVLHTQWTGRSPLRPLGTLLAAIGVYSYSIYLWHTVVLTGGIRSLNMLMGGTLTYFPALGIYVVASLIVGAGISQLVEGRALRLRDRLFPSQSGRQTVGTVGSADSAPAPAPASLNPQASSPS